MHLMNTSLYYLKPKIIEPTPILCMSEVDIMPELHESKERMDMELKMNRLYIEAGKYFIEKYLRGDE